MKQHTDRFLAFLLALAMLLSVAACSSSGGKEDTTATTMHLMRTEGTVAVSDGDGKDVPLLSNLALYSGYGVGTRSASYAWINLDDVKLTKLDQNSEISIQKDGKALDIELKSGSLFFNVTKPLEDDETMEIRVSTMLVGVRGTCGWVDAHGDSARAYILEGKVECSAEGQTVQVNAGEFAELAADGELTVREFTEQDIPAFVRDEVDEDRTGGPDSTPTPGNTETLEPAPAETPSVPEGDLVASGEAGGNVTWALYSDGTLVISGTGPMDDYGYENPAPWSEYYHSYLPWFTVVIEDGVTSVGEWAFSGGLLTSVTIGNGVTNIGERAFQQCSGLRSVTIGSSVTSIGGYAFFSCFNLPDLTLPDSLTSIGEAAFWQCGSLTGVDIPGSVTSIGDSAFLSCASLASVTIGSGVTSIGVAAFEYCGKLTDVTIPVSVTSIGERAFTECYILTDVYYGGSESQWNQIDGSNRAGIPTAAIHYNS